MGLIKLQDKFMFFVLGLHLRGGFHKVMGRGCRWDTIRVDVFSLFRDYNICADDLLVTPPMVFNGIRSIGTSCKDIFGVTRARNDQSINLVEGLLIKLSGKCDDDNCREIDRSNRNLPPMEQSGKHVSMNVSNIPAFVLRIISHFALLQRDHLGDKHENFDATRSNFVLRMNELCSNCKFVNSFSHAKNTKNQKKSRRGKKRKRGGSLGGELEERDYM